MRYYGNGLLLDALCKDIALSHANKYKLALWKDLKTIEILSEAGHEIQWNSNDRWCTVNGRTFNVHKTVYQANVIDSKLPDSFSAFSADSSGRYKLAVKYACYGHDNEVIFDAAVIDSEDVDLDKLLDEDNSETLVPQWVVNNLNNYGNCAVRCPIPFFLTDLEDLLDFEITVEHTGDGMLIKRVYEN